MRVKYYINDYLLAWYLLFKDSPTQNLCNLKRKLWINYKKQYNGLFYDREKIISDYKNFIPDNDTIYNIIIDSPDFKLLKKELEKKRFNLIKNWDSNKKIIENLEKNIIRNKLEEYNCLLINDYFSLHETYKKNKLVILGKKFKNENDLIINLVFEIVKNEIKISINSDHEIKDAIIEMAILNEFGTLINKESCYKEGHKNLFNIKKQIYPYWLMYLGIKREDMVEYMMRDKIAFESKNYAYEKELVKMDLKEFIEFVIRNKRYIIKEEKKTYIEEII